MAIALQHDGVIRLGLGAEVLTGVGVPGVEAGGAGAAREQASGMAGGMGNRIRGEGDRRDPAALRGDRPLARRGGQGDAMELAAIGAEDQGAIARGGAPKDHGQGAIAGNLHRPEVAPFR